MDIATLKVEVKADGTGKVTKGLDRLYDSSKRVETQVQKQKKGFNALSTQLGRTGMALAGLVGFGSLSALLTTTTKKAAAFEKAMAEVATLSNTINMSKLTEQVKDLSVQFGQSKITQAKALYQVISAGAANATEATQILTVANQLAVGGVTDVATAADGLTSALNAYGATAASAQGFSDSMFVAMRAGKTTIEELSSNVGKLAPLAAQAGVSFDALMAATAAVTKTGLSTSETMTSLRQVLVSVVKPTKEAQETAQQLGIDFSIAAVKSKGFAGFLSELQEKTGGSTKAMSRLFGSVEALQSALFLASETGNNEFNRIMDDMRTKTGETEKAFETMSKTTGFLTDKLLEQLNSKFAAVGTTVLTVLNPALQFLVANFETLSGAVAALGQMFIAGAFLKSLQLMPLLLLKVKSSLLAAVAAFKLLNAAMMANPFIFIAKTLAVVGAALFAFRDKMIQVGDSTTTVGRIISATWEVVTKKAKGFLVFFGKLTDRFGKFISVNFRKILSGAQDFFSVFFRNVLNAAKTWTNTVIKLFNLIGKGIGIVVQHIQENWLNMWKNILNLGKSAWAAIQDIFNGDLSFTRFQKQVTEGMIQPVETLSSKLKDMWHSVAGKDYVGDAVNAFNNVKSEVMSLATETSNAEASAKDLNDELGNTDANLDTMGGTAARVDKQLDQLLTNNTKKANVFDQALERMVGRIDEHFAQAWKGAFKSFGDFTKGIKNAFKNLLAEMAHLAITRPIILKIGAKLGIPGLAAQAAGAAASTGAASGNGLGALTSMFGNVKSLMTGAGLAKALGSLGMPFAKGLMALSNMAHGAGMMGVSGFLNNAVDGLMKTGQGLSGGAAGAGLGSLATAGAGVAGGMISRNLWGAGTGTDIGSTIGGIGGGLAAAGSAAAGGSLAALGAAAGPIGALVGAILGGALGSIFNKKPKKKTAFAEVDLSKDGKVSVGGWDGKQFSQENRDAVGNLAKVGKAFSDLLGGSNLKLDFAKDNRRGFWFNEVNYGNDVDSLMKDMFSKILANAKNLDDGLKNLITTFKGTPKEIFSFAKSVMTINKLLEFDPVGKAMESIEKALAKKKNTVALDAFAEQIEKTQALFDAYDGSAASAVKLAKSLSDTAKAAYSLAVGILTLKKNIDGMFNSTIKNMRESVMTQEERVAAWTAERDRLRRELETMRDPKQIGETAKRIADLTRKLFDQLDEETKRANVETYAKYLEDVNKFVQDKLQGQVDSIKTSFAELQERNAQVMSKVAEQQRKAAEDMQRAARDMITAANNFPRSISVRVQQEQVPAARSPFSPGGQLAP